MVMPSRVMVLMGGPSAEHAISLKSGHGVLEALSRRGWCAEAVVLPDGVTTEEAIRAARAVLEHDPPSVVFIALHGAFGEDGTLQRLCEELGLPYTGSGPAASRLGMDKVASRRRFEQAGLRVPRWSLLERAADGKARALGGYRFPVVVKPTNQGSSLGVSMAANEQELASAIDEAGRYDARILIEECVRGRELTVGILRDRALPVVEIRSSHPFFDYAAKYTPGQTTYHAPAALESSVARRVQRAGLSAHRAVGCRDFSRVDCLLDGANQPVVLEVNTIPGLTATSLLPKAAACAGLSYDELCDRVVRMALAHPRSAMQLSGRGGRIRRRRPSLVEA